MMQQAHTDSTRRAGLELWFAHPRDLNEPDVRQACLAILDEQERARAARFKFERHCREYIATHALTRVALSHAHVSPPNAWRFFCNKWGKPFPDPDCGVRFNQSNSLELAVCLIALPGPSAAAAEVGVDVESSARAAEIVPLAPRVFSAAERAQLDALPAEERPDRALSLWTLKEAYIKARGMGLSLPLHKISFLFEEANFDGRKADRLPAFCFEADPSVDDNPGRWRFCRLDYAGHRIAMAVETSAVCDPKIFEARPPLALPARIALPVPSWYPLDRRA